MHTTGARRHGIAAAVLGLAAAGCRSFVAAEHDPDRLDRLGFVQVGETSRAVILGRLGEPHGRFEGDRVWIYLLRAAGGRDGYQRIEAVPRGNPDVVGPEVYDLVLLFGPDDALVRRELLRVR